MVEKAIWFPEGSIKSTKCRALASGRRCTSHGAQCQYCIRNVPCVGEGKAELVTLSLEEFFDGAETSVGTQSILGMLPVSRAQLGLHGCRIRWHTSYSDLHETEKSVGGNLNLVHIHSYSSYLYKLIHELSSFEEKLLCREEQEDLLFGVRILLI